MRLGLFGGTFDPIHRGHVVPVVEAVRRLELTRVLYLPTANPPHKPAQELTPAAARFVMVELALLDHPELQVDDFEMRTEGPHYTIDTVRHFAASLPNARLFYLVGADSLGDLPQWRRAEELLSRVELVVLARAGWRLDETLERLPPAARSVLERATIHLIENRPLDISSRRLREQLRGGAEDARASVDPLVLRYATKYGLYRASDA